MRIFGFAFVLLLVSFPLQQAIAQTNTYDLDVFIIDINGFDAYDVGGQLTVDLDSDLIISSNVQLGINGVFQPAVQTRFNSGTGGVIDFVDVDGVLSVVSGDTDVTVLGPQFESANHTFSISALPEFDEFQDITFGTSAPPGQFGSFPGSTSFGGDTAANGFELGTLAAVAATVPEPSSLVVLLLGTLSIGSRRRRTA